MGKKKKPIDLVWLERAHPVNAILKAIADFEPYDDLDSVTDVLKRKLESIFKDVPQHNYRKTLARVEYYPNGLCKFISTSNYYNYMYYGLEGTELTPYDAVSEDTDDDYWRNLLGMLFRDHVPPIIAFQMRLKLGMKIGLGINTEVGLTKAIERYNTYLALDKEMQKSVDVEKLKKSVKIAGSAALGFVDVNVGYYTRSSKYHNEITVDGKRIRDFGRIQRGTTRRDFRYRGSGSGDIRPFYLTEEGIIKMTAVLESWRQIHGTSPDRAEPDGTVKVPYELSKNVKEIFEYPPNLTAVTMSDSDLAMLASSSSMIKKARTILAMFDRVNEPHAAKAFELMGCRKKGDTIEVQVEEAEDQEPECNEEEMEAQG